MIFRETSLGGVFVVEPEPREDERGSFARVFCAREFAARGLPMPVAQSSYSFNRTRGTLRGMHLQRPPHAESKLVSCIRGAAYDVALDLREGSPTFGRWAAFELVERGAMVFLPPGVAHGFQTLEDETVLLYQISAEHSPDHSVGVRFDDPAFGIAWPLPCAVVSARDLAFAPWPGVAA